MRLSPGRWSRRPLVPLLILAGVVAQAQDPLLDILDRELKREMALLAKQASAPYHITYRVDDVQRWDLGASMGALTRRSSGRQRFLHVQVRVGDLSLDSSHELRGNMDFFGGRRSRAALPLEDDSKAIAAVLWKETDAVWRAAVDRFAKVKANVAVKVKAEDASADFTAPAQPSVSVDPRFAFPAPDLDAWGQRLRTASAAFLGNPRLHEGGATFQANFTRRYIVSSDGTRVVQNLPSSRVFLSATTKAEDGMELPLYHDFFSFDPARLPEAEVLKAEAKRISGVLAAMRTAPVVEPFSGPALLSGDSSGVFFHEIFGHRVEGHRQKSESDGQTFKKKLGERILPETFTVFCDPRTERYAGQDLNGSYRFDDEGMPAGRVDIIQDGVLKHFLMSRSPIEGFSASNGHGRAEIGFDPVSRQSNLIIESREKLSEEALKARFLDEVRKQGKPYGLYFKRVTGGFTMTGRFLPNAFNVTPTEVYRLYADGRPDELVRGVDLVGTPLVIFSHVMAAGGDVRTFTGTCGAESGGVPVSCVSPTLLIRQIEVQKKEKSPDRPPILDRPALNPQGGEL